MTGKKCNQAMLIANLLGCLVNIPCMAQAQTGPKVQDCYETSGRNGKTRVIAKYGGCFVGRQSDGSVNFIQWKNGTATTGLAVWKRRSDGKCFTLQEDPLWSICAD
jgi:hypothetical protein